VTTFAGTGGGGYADGPLASALFNSPAYLAYDAQRGALYVGERGGHRLRVVAGGAVATLAGGNSSGYADGVGTAAALNAPTGLALYAANASLFFAEVGNHRIRSLSLVDGSVRTVAGTGAAAWVDGLAAVASFNAPEGLALTTVGAPPLLLVADAGNNRIRAYNMTSPASPLVSPTPAPAGTRIGPGYPIALTDGAPYLAPAGGCTVTLAITGGGGGGGVGAGEGAIVFSTMNR
jgi:sugar lactone lactonase YvrE